MTPDEHPHASSSRSASGPPPTSPTRTTWTEHFDAAELAELDAALRHALAPGPTTSCELGTDDFPLPDPRATASPPSRTSSSTAAASCASAASTAAAYTQAEMEVLYWGIGTHLGSPWAQNKHGHVLGDVTDQHKAPDDPTARGNELGGIAPAVPLRRLRPRRPDVPRERARGGLSAVANSVRIHNRLVARATRPRRGPLRAAARTTTAASRPPAASRTTRCPCFTEWEGRLFVRCIPPLHLGVAAPPRRAPPHRRCRPRPSRAVDAHGRTTRPTTSTWSCGPATCSSSTTTTCSTAARPTRTTAPPGSIRHLKRLWLETNALKDRPPYFANRSHWEANRSASRIRRDNPRRRTMRSRTGRGS